MRPQSTRASAFVCRRSGKRPALLAAVLIFWRVGCSAADALSSCRTSGRAREEIGRCRTAAGIEFSHVGNHETQFSGWRDSASGRIWFDDIRKRGTRNEGTAFCETLSAALPSRDDYQELIAHGGGDVFNDLTWFLTTTDDPERPGTAFMYTQGRLISDWLAACTGCAARCVSSAGALPPRRSVPLPRSSGPPACQDIKTFDLRDGDRCRTATGAVFARVVAKTKSPRAWKDEKSGRLWYDDFKKGFDLDGAKSYCRTLSADLASEDDFEDLVSHDGWEVLPKAAMNWFRTTTPEVIFLFSQHGHRFSEDFSCPTCGALCVAGGTKTRRSHVPKKVSPEAKAQAEQLSREGQADFMEKRFARAREEWAKALSLDPGNEYAHDGLVRVAPFLGPGSESQKDAHFLYLTGISHWQRGEYAAAISDLSRAKELAPDDPQIKGTLENVKKQATPRLAAPAQEDDAKKAAQHHYWDGWTYSTRGDFEQAEREFRAAKALDPADARVDDALARVAAYEKDSAIPKTIVRVHAGTRCVGLTLAGPSTVEQRSITCPNEGPPPDSRLPIPERGTYWVARGSQGEYRNEVWGYAHPRPLSRSD